MILIFKSIKKDFLNLTDDEEQKINQTCGKLIAESAKDVWDEINEYESSNPDCFIGVDIKKWEFEYHGYPTYLSAKINSLIQENFDAHTFNVLVGNYLDSKDN